MPPNRNRSTFIDRLIGLLHRLDPKEIQSLVERLARERSFLETIFDTIEDGVVVLDEHGKIAFFNQAVTRMLGFDPTSAEGQSIRNFLKDLDWDALLLMDKAGGRKVQRHEFEVTYPRQRFLTMFVSPLDGSAVGSSGLVLILHDVTEMRHKTHEAIETERVQALTLLAASVAHEIGNPLNALSIHMQLMERELAKIRTSKGSRRGVSSPSQDLNEETIQSGFEKMENYLEVAKGEIARLDYIVTQFLQAIRPVKPKLLLCDVNQLIREAVELLRPEIENRGVCLEEKLATGLPQAEVDAGQIKQVLVNLVKNALQAMTKGGRLILSTRSAPDGLWLCVADTGGGIPADMLSRIFEPFYTTKKKGSGLGLMIVQRIVREHAGRMELESHVGRGTQFRIWLPLTHETAPRLLLPPT